MSDTPAKTETHSVGDVLTVKSKDGLDVTYPDGDVVRFGSSDGEVHVVLHTAGTFTVGPRKVEVS